MLERWFNLKAHGTTVSTEILAGFTTFVTMVYIIFVNPAILGDAGMPKEAVFIATILTSALGTLIMGFFANLPIGVAPGMGLNAFFAYTVVLGMGYSWQQALGAVFISGICFLIITVLKLRQEIIRQIPNSLRIAITAGIGLFLGLIALKSSGIVVDHPATLVTLGDMRKPEALLAIFGFFLIVVLEHYRVKGSILIGILSVTVLSFVFTDNSFQGLVAMPPAVDSTLFQLDISGILSMGLLNVVLVFFLVELFDATGTLMGVAQRAGLDRNRDSARLNRALMADSCAIVAGSLLGTSSATAYIESAAGVQEGGRTGLTAVTIALLFLLCLFLSPLAAVVPAYSTAPALLYVACLMVRELIDIEWNEISESIPSALTALLMPFTYSVANGIAFGFISYAILKLATGKAKTVSPMVWVVAGLFILRYATIVN